MSGEIEGVSDVATGALLARAVGRHEAGGGPDGGICLNCGTARIGPHCHRCGQGGNIHRSIGAIWHDLLHGVLHFEGKLWRTLPLLMFRPGELMRRYVDGERTRFVSPMAMFLFSVFSLFAVLSILGIAPPADIGGSAGKIEAGFSQQRAVLDASRARAVATRDATTSSSFERGAAIREIADHDELIAEMGRIRPIVDLDGSDGTQIRTGWQRLDKGIAKTEKNPGLALYKLQANSYKFSWLLIPLSIPFIWIMFAWRAQFRAYDHAVFVTYSIAFMSLLFITLTLLGASGVSMGVLGVIGSVVPVAHLYRQFRGGYRLKRWTAFVRTLVLAVVAIPIILGLFLTVLLGLGLVG